MIRIVIASLLLTVGGQNIPVLPNSTNWGKLTQVGKDFRIEGHPNWDAVGRIRDDGKVFVLWSLRSTGDPCPGVYEIKCGELIGLWGFGTEVEIKNDGSIGGEVRADRIYLVEVPDN